MYINCPDCKFENKAGSVFCAKCGSRLPNGSASNIQEMTHTMRPGQNHEPISKALPAPDYTGLKTVIRFYDFIAWFVIIFTVIGAIFVLISAPLGNISYTLLMVVAIFVYGFFSFISLKAVSEGIKLFIDIESNTRKTTNYILQLVATQKRDNQ